MMDASLSKRVAGSNAAASSEELVGRTLREITHPDDVRAAQTHRAQLELGVTDSYLIDQRFRRRWGLPHDPNQSFCL